MNPRNHTVVLDCLEFILLELPKFTPETWSLAHKKIAILWLRFLKEIDGYYHELPEELTSNKLIFSAIQKCEEAALSPEEREAYERSKEQVMWDRSIKGLEDAVVEKDKIIASQANELAELRKMINCSPLEETQTGYVNALRAIDEMGTSYSIDM